MKVFITVLTLATVLLVGCNKTPVVATNPTQPTGPNKALILIIGGVDISCSVYAPYASTPSARKWVATCPTLAQEVEDAFATTGTAAKIQTALADVKTFIANAPVDIPVAEGQKIQAILGAVQSFLNLYLQLYPPTT